ncbi:uncharacterized protein LOC123874827 [Maniola jurtina]|uniref:uncharacterized protein LOC123874827 n=1 Tax=Maniola jurtina TaxID=191418 RepID=UPI001E6880C9|nr:uncharacterized protein LOC123874827 [Maniola jurtina]
MLQKLLIFCVLSIVLAEKVRYDDYSLYKIHPDNEGHLNFLSELQKENDGVHFWKTPFQVGDYASVVASPEKKEYLEHSLRKRSINYELMMENIQQAFDDQIISRKKRDTRKELFWTNFQTMSDIYEWFQHLANTHSDMVSIIRAGQSYEGRNITGVRISRGSRSNRPVIFVEAGQVGADWLSPTVVTYLVDQLVRGVDTEARQASEDFEWHIFPILNPDGHEFSQDSDRLWIKSRRPTIGSAIGVDLSRNWNSHWGIIGGSFVPIDHNYIGLGPFTEVETRSVSRYIESISSRLVSSLSFRAFGQRLLIPFAHSTSPMYNYNETVIIGRRAMGSLSVRYQTLFTVGTSRTVHDGATGSIADWIKHRFNPPVVFTYQLRDQGAWGYTLPVNQVLPSCEETFDSVMAIIREAKFIFNSILLISFASCEKIRFENYTLYKIFPENGEQIKILQDIRNNDVRYDFWTEPMEALGFLSVMSSPQDKNYLEDLLNRNQIKYDVKIRNVQELLDKETVRTIKSNNITEMKWDAYYGLADINSWLSNLVTAHGDVASLAIGGQSYYMRPIIGMKISHGPGRRAIFIEGTMHAREWITTTAVCYIINELLTSNDTDTRAAAREFDWYIFPVTNPDGYLYSHEENRMWRKNRRYITGTHYGVDLNRNWNSNWLVAGSSTNPAMDNYAGPGPFSETETRSLSTYINSIGDQIELFLSFHSFGQLLLVPFGNSTEPYANYNDAINIGRRAMGALSVRHGTQYVTGNIAEAIYMATGGCIDWVKERVRIPLVYCYELRDRGNYGFLLPEDQILPNNQEVMDSVLEMVYQAKRFGYMATSGVQTQMYTNTLLMFIIVGLAFFL